MDKLDSYKRRKMLENTMSVQLSENVGDKVIATEFNQRD